MNDERPESRTPDRILLTVLAALGTGIGVFLGVWFLVYGLNFGPFSRTDAGAVLRDYALQLFSGTWESARIALRRDGVLPWFTLTLWIASLPAILGAGAVARSAWKALERGTHYRGARLVERADRPQSPGSSGTDSALRVPHRILLTVLAALIAGTGVFSGVWFLVYGRDLGPVLRTDSGTVLRDYALRLFSGTWESDRIALGRDGVLPWFALTLWVAGLPAVLGAGAVARSAWRVLKTGPSFRGVRIRARLRAWITNLKTAGPSSSPMPFAIAGVTTAPDLPCSHILIGATTGAGKSNVLQNGVLDRIRDGCDRRPEQEKALVIDSGGEFLKTRGTGRDLILNPFDRRSRTWNPFLEIRQESDFALVANAVLPDSPSASQPEWIGMGREFLIDVMKSQAKNRKTGATPAETFRLVVSAEIGELSEILAGTPSEVLIKGTSNERLLANIRYEASRAMRAWQLLKTGGDFSVRQWIREGSGVLFLTYRESEMDSLKNLIGAWLSLALRETLSLPADPDRRVWFVADELDSLGRVDYLDKALSMGRKYGLAMIATVQSVAQFERTYGADTARVLLSVFASKLVMKQGGAYDAEHWSREIGEIEEWRTSRSQNTGASGGSSGTNEALHHGRLVLPSELMDLPKFSGYMRLADRTGIRKFELPFRKREERFPAFVPAGTDDNDVPAPPVGEDAASGPGNPEVPGPVPDESGAA